MSHNKKADAQNVKLELSDELKKLLYSYYKSIPNPKTNGTENLIVDLHSSLLEKILKGNETQYGVQPNEIRFMRYFNDHLAGSALSNVTNITSDQHATPDSEGAAMYVVVVIIWYFFGVVAFVAWQMKKKKTPNDYKTELLSQGLEDQVKTKQILEELRNPSMRKWAWTIYSTGQGSSVDTKYEMQVLANLNKRLIQIEKKKLRLKDDYATSDSASPVDAIDFEEKKKALLNASDMFASDKLLPKMKRNRPLSKSLRPRSLPFFGTLYRSNSEKASPSTDDWTPTASSPKETPKITFKVGDPSREIKRYLSKESCRNLSTLREESSSSVEYINEKTDESQKTDTALKVGKTDQKEEVARDQDLEEIKKVVNEVPRIVIAEREHESDPNEENDYLRIEMI